MFAQVSSVTLNPGRIDEWIALTRDVILPAAKRREGFVSAILLVDRQTSTGVGVSLWETQASIDEGVASGFYLEQVAKAGACLAAPPERQVFEVAARL